MFASKMILAGAAGTACVVLGLFLGGCESADSNPAKPEARGPIGTTDLTGSSDFDRDLIAAKQGTAGNAERFQAIEDVLSRYGVPHSPGRLDLDTQPGPVAEAAGKTAAASTFITTVRNFTANNGNHTFYKQVVLDAGKSFTATATAGSDGVDPVLIAFFRDDDIDKTNAYAIKVVAHNDDVANNNRNSRITWKNTSLLNVSLVVLAFNYLPENSGAVDISINTGAGTSTFPSRWLGGKIVYAASLTPVIPANCSPVFTRATEWNRLGRSSSAAALVVDIQSMKGGILWDSPDEAPLQSLDFVPQLSNSFPGFALLFQATSKARGSIAEEVSSYGYKQENFYRCR